MNTIRFFVVLSLITLSGGVNNGCKEESTSPTSGSCDLTQYYNDLSSQINQRNLLENKTWGDEHYLGPKYLTVNLNIDALLTPNIYTERIWMMSLWDMALQLATRSGKVDELKNDEHFAQILNYAETVVERAGPVSSRNFIPFAQEVGTTFRDLLVQTGAFRSRNATIRNTYGRLGNVIGALGFVLQGISSLDQAQKNLALANNLVVWYYFEAFVIPTVKQNQLYNSDPALKRAVDNYEQAANVSAITQNEILAQTLVVDATSAVLAAVVYAEIGAQVGAAIGSIVPVAGNAAGALAGALIGAVFYISADQFNAGGEFILNNDKASRLLTLGLTPLANNDNQIFLQSFSIFSGVYQIKHFVLGKGLAQNLGGLIGVVVQTEERRWTDFLAASFNPIEDLMSNCYSQKLKELVFDSDTFPINGLLCYYPFNGNVNDESGNGKNGTPVNSPTYGTGRSTSSGSALQLNGTNQYVSLPNSISITNEISISFWMKTNLSDNASWPSGTFIVDRDLCNAQRDWSVGLGSGGKLQFNTGKVGTDYVLTSTSNANDDTWKHITVIRDTMNQIKKIYINGQLNTSVSFDKQAFANNSINIYVGASVCATSTHHYYKGLIDDIRIYNRVLTEAEIQLLYNDR